MDEWGTGSVESMVGVSCGFLAIFNCLRERKGETKRGREREGGWEGRGERGRGRGEEKRGKRRRGAELLS